MRIALTIPTLGPGGAERVILSLAHHWVDQGHEVMLITLEAPGTAAFYPCVDRIQRYYLDQWTPPDSPWWLRLQKIGARLWALRNIFKILNPDLILSFMDLMNMSVLLAGIGLKNPVIACERIDPAHRPLAFFLKCLRLCLYPRACQLVVQTESAATYFPKSFRRFIRIIPNAVPQPVFCKEHHVPSIRKLLSVGRLTSQKDHQTLIRAFAQVQKKYSKLNLDIYGEGPEHSNLVHLLQELGVEKYVQLRAPVSYIQDVLLDADLFIFPSLYEGFSNALCEAMAIGLPIIASDCAANLEIVTEGMNGRLFPVGDVDRLTALMLELIQDHAQCMRLGNQAKKLSETLSPERVWPEWDRLLDTVVPTSPA